MMGPGFGEELHKAFIAFIIFLVVVAFAIGGLTVWLLPKLWEWVKPFLHSLTA